LQALSPGCVKTRALSGNLDRVPFRAFGCPPHREFVLRTGAVDFGFESIPTTEDNHK